MKDFLSAEEASALTKLGIPRSVYNRREGDGKGIYYTIDIPGILDILPKIITENGNEFNLNIDWNKRVEAWCATYQDNEGNLLFLERDDFVGNCICIGSEFINALYDLLIWTIDNNYLDLKKL